MSAEIYEKIGHLTSKIDALHGRQDRTESLVKDELHQVNTVLKELLEFMHQSKGWANASKFILGAIGGSGVVLLIKFFINQ